MNNSVMYKQLGKFNVSLLRGSFRGEIVSTHLLTW